MNYIKAYKLFEGSGDDMKFLNREMIANLKDLCIEEFDNHNSLFIQFFNGNNPRPIAYAFINHNIDDYVWYNNNMRCLKMDYTSKIYYQWRIMKEQFDIDNWFHRPTNSIYTTDISEIDDRIKSMYPDEDIKYIGEI